MNSVEILKIIFYALGSSGIILYFIKLMMKQYVNKSFEKFKNNLHIEHFKFSRLHEERAQVIKEIYAKLCNFEKELESFTSPLEFKELAKVAKVKKTEEVANDFLDYYRKNRIFFNKETCNLLDDINKNFKKAWNNMILSMNQPSLEGSIKKWGDAWDIAVKDIPLLRQKLENDFRKTLGVN